MLFTVLAPNDDCVYVEGAEEPREERREKPSSDTAEERGTSAFRRRYV